MKHDMTKGKRDLILIALVLAAALLCFLVRNPQKKAAREADKVLVACVQVSGKEVLRVPLSEDGKYIVKDGRAKPVTGEETLTPDETKTDASGHDVNIILVENHSIRCVESNCDNQICVNTPALTENAYDTPIVCLPHGMFLYLTMEEPDS